MIGLSSSRLLLLFLVFSLFAGGVVQILHRHLSLGIPLLPSASRDVWFVDAKVTFEATGGPVTVSFALPDNQTGYTLLGENLVSPGYGISLLPYGGSRRAEWTIADTDGTQKLYYKAQFAADNLIVPSPDAPLSLALEPPLSLDEVDQAAAQEVLTEAIEKSAGPLSLTRQILKILTRSPPTQTVELLRTNFEPADLLITLLTQGGVSARSVFGLELEDGRRRKRLKSFIEVFADGELHLFDPATGTEGRPDNLLLWAPGALSILDVQGGQNSDLTFSILLQEEGALESVLSQLGDLGQDDFSIYRLPLEEQALLKGMFLIPIGALVVVFIRVIIGFRTSGTFMPVLLAIAFIQTKLIPGLIGFVLIVGTGLIVRSYLSTINLLLVARISATLSVVIGLTILFTLLSERMGLENIQNFTFFPLIIMSWTIERMSILWEEEGPKEVLIQASGTLVVAVVAYALMATPIVRHLSFNFLGLQLVILSLILLMGQYTGYRVLELHRFRSLGKDV